MCLSAPRGTSDPSEPEQQVSNEKLSNCVGGTLGVWGLGVEAAWRDTYWDTWLLLLKEGKSPYRLNFLSKLLSCSTSPQYL